VRKTRRIMIAKREGELEPFETAKLRRCLAAAMETCNRDERFADALAHAVELHLRDWSESRPPTTEYIFRCLRIALTETGMDQVARQLARHRRRRANQRRAVSVRDARGERRALAPWRKATVAGTLERRHGLRHPVARILAGEVERRVLALEYGVVSTTLITELVRSELSAWGLTDGATNAAPRVLDGNLVAGHRAEKER